MKIKLEAKAIAENAVKQEEELLTSATLASSPEAEFEELMNFLKFLYFKYGTRVSIKMETDSQMKHFVEYTINGQTCRMSFWQNFQVGGDLDSVEQK